MRELTGAKVYVMRGDEGVIASGGRGQYLYAQSRWTPCPVDRVLEDGDEVKLGGVTLVARRTPGHTRGCTTWAWRVRDGGRAYDAQKERAFRTTLAAQRGAKGPDPSR